MAKYRSLKAGVTVRNVREPEFDVPDGGEPLQPRAPGARGRVIRAHTELARCGGSRPPGAGGRARGASGPRFWCRRAFGPAGHGTLRAAAQCRWIDDLPDAPGQAVAVGGSFAATARDPNRWRRHLRRRSGRPGVASRRAVRRTSTLERSPDDDVESGSPPTVHFCLPAVRTRVRTRPIVSSNDACSLRERDRRHPQPSARRFCRPPSATRRPNPVPHGGDAPVIRLVNLVLMSAIHKGASDVHFEPYEKEFRVRFPHRRDPPRRHVTADEIQGRDCVASEDHGEARHCREAASAGRPYQAPVYRPRRSRKKSTFELPAYPRCSEKRSCCGCSTARR